MERLSETSAEILAGRGERCRPCEYESGSHDRPDLRRFCTKAQVKAVGDERSDYADPEPVEQIDGGKPKQPVPLVTLLAGRGGWFPRRARRVREGSQHCKADRGTDTRECKNRR